MIKARIHVLMTYKNGCKTEDGNYMENLIFKDNKEAVKWFLETFGPYSEECASVRGGL